VQNKALAETLRLIAANGPDCFYVVRACENPLTPGASNP